MWVPPDRGGQGGRGRAGRRSARRHPRGSEPSRAPCSGYLIPKALILPFLARAASRRSRRPELRPAVSTSASPVMPHRGGRMTPQLVTNSSCRYLNTIGMERLDAIGGHRGGARPALAGPDRHGLFRSPASRTSPPSCATSASTPRCRSCPQMHGLPESDYRNGGASRSSPWRATSTPACAASSRPPSPRPRPTGCAPPCAPSSAT